MKRPTAVERWWGRWGGRMLVAVMVAYALFNAYRMWRHVPGH